MKEPHHDNVPAYISIVIWVSDLQKCDYHSPFLQFPWSCSPVTFSCYLRWNFWKGVLTITTL